MEIHFLVMEKSWKIIDEKEWSVVTLLNSTKKFFFKLKQMIDWSYIARDHSGAR